MKFDMHCHTREGSVDAKVGIESYIRQLMEKGFDGMLVTDHNSYDGYRWFRDSGIASTLKDSFTVLKGIEYDTCDGGHMVIVLPDGIRCKLLELRGLSVEKLEKLVHKLGGILGPAHPYGTGFFALMNNRWVKKHQEIIDKFDFIETFNSCTHQASNSKAKKLAISYKKPQIAGSDAHKSSFIGTACTVFDKSIRCNNDLIRAVKEKRKILACGPIEKLPPKKVNPLIRELGIIGYWIYNKMGALIKLLPRSRELKSYFSKEI